MSGQRWLEQFGQDLRYTFRMLRHSPSFTAVAVLSLALGIGANTAIFTVIDAFMLRKLPVKNPEQLVTFRQTLSDGSNQPTFSYQDFERFADLNQVFSGMFATTWADRYNVTINGPGGGMDEGQARVSVVTGNYFSILGVNAHIGRTLTEDDDRAEGASPVIVISYAYWQRKFGLASDVVGRTLSLNGHTYDIIGVTPQGFSGEWTGWPTDFWVPVAMQYQTMAELAPGGPRGARTHFKIVARLQPGVTIPQAQAAGDVLYQELLKSPPTPSGLRNDGRFEIVSAATGYSPQRDSFKQPLLILMIVVAVVLLIACANVANLLLARSAARQKEMAVRLAMGAGRGRIVRQLLTESIFLAAVGGALGLLFAQWATNVLAKLASSGPVSLLTGAGASIDLDLRPDAQILAFTIALCFLTGILFGLAPAFRGSKVSLVAGLSERGTGSGGAVSKWGRFSLRKMLVISQVALSLVLLIGAGLFVRTLGNMKSDNLGIDRDHVLLVWILPGQTGRQGPELMSFWGNVRERVSSLPGVVNASPSNNGLLNGGPGSGGPVTVEGYTAKPNEEPRAQAHTIGPGFFDTVGQRLLSGRDFAAQDTEQSPKVVIISESMARLFFGDESPIGKRLKAGSSTSSAPLLEIVGVVSDAKYNVREKDQMKFYYPYRQQSGNRLSRMCLAVRAAGNPITVASSVRQELRNIDSNLPVLKIDTVDEQLEDVLFQERLITNLSVFFAVLAVVLACLGLYGVISYTVARRTSEIGIRLALGATPARVLKMILRESLLLVFVGIAVGIPAALALARLISARMFGISATDPVTIAAATLLMIAVATLASLVPARRAARVDPMVTLRYE